MQNKSHLSVLIHEQAKVYGARPALTFRAFGSLEWKSVSWKQFSLRVKQVSNAMLNLAQPNCISGLAAHSLYSMLLLRHQR